MLKNSARELRTTLGGGEVKSNKKDWASVARGAARSSYDGGPRLESNEPSLYEGSDEEF